MQVGPKPAAAPVLDADTRIKQEVATFSGAWVMLERNGAKPENRRSRTHEQLLGTIPQTTQIYEGTNQIQRVVISKRLLS